MEKVLQLQRQLLRSRRLPGIVIGLALAILGMVIWWSGLQLRQKVREQIANQDGEVLHAVSVLQQYADEPGEELVSSLDDPAEQFNLMMRISRLKGVLGIRLFAADGKFFNAFPAYITESEVTRLDLSKLRAFQPVSRFYAEGKLCEYDLLAEKNARVPLLVVDIPVQPKDQARLVGIAQFILQGEGIARSYGELDRNLLLQGALAFLVGGGIMGFTLAWAFRRIQRTNQLLAERTESLSRANRELVLAAKSSAVGAVAAHLIHGLKNPLSGLQSFVNSRLESACEDPDNDWREAVATAQRMQALIAQVVRILEEQQAMGEYEISLQELVEILAAKLVPIAKSLSVDFQAELHAEGTLSNRDANLIILILENLIQNALQATPSGKKVCLRLLGSGEEIQFEVRDEGNGFPSALRAQLFAPCRSTKEGGGGIGLAISKQLANHLGATLELVNSNAQGCVFRLVLPRNAEMAISSGIHVPSKSETIDRTAKAAFLLAVLFGLSGTINSARAERWRWSNPTPHGNNVVDMACNNGLVVQVAERGQIYTSADFDNWTPRDSHTTLNLQAVTFFGYRIVITGENGAALYSDDGVNFVYTNLITSDWLVSVTASSNLVVAVGDDAAIYTSLNGAYWKRQGLPQGNTGAKWLRGVAYGGGTFVIVGESGYIASSPNGTNWTYRGNSLFANDLNRVVWLNTPNSPTNGFASPSFLAVSDGGRVLTSTNNGVTWTEMRALGTNALFAAAGNDSTRLLAGDEDLRLGSVVTNTLVWPRQVGPLPPYAPAWTYYSALWETNGFYLLAGQSGMIVKGAPGTNSLYSWQTPFSSSRDWLWQVTTAAGLYVTVGDHARILTSDNGIDWTPEDVPYTNSVTSTGTVFFAVGGTTNMLIAVGNRGSIALSPNNLYPVIITNSDGTTLTNQVSSLGIVWCPMPALTTNDLHAVGFFQNNYLVAGGNGTLLSSPDGTNWTSLPSPVSTYLSSLESFPGGAVAVGDNGTILTSTDGNSWTKRSSGTTNWIYRVRYLQGRLIAVGENGVIFTSTNGLSWTPTLSGTTAWLNDVQSVSNICYIVGTQGTVLSSTNLATWASIGTITEKSLYSAATQNGQLIVVGIEGVIIRSQIIPDLTPIEFLGFSRVSGFNIFSVAGNPDQQFTLDSSVNLLNWTTGPLLELLYSSGTLLFLQNTGTNAPFDQFFRTTLVQ